MILNLTSIYSSKRYTIYTVVVAQGFASVSKVLTLLLNKVGELFPPAEMNTHFTFKFGFGVTGLAIDQNTNVLSTVAI